MDFYVVDTSNFIRRHINVRRNPVFAAVPAGLIANYLFGTQYPIGDYVRVFKYLTPILKYVFTYSHQKLFSYVYKRGCSKFVDLLIEEKNARILRHALKECLECSCQYCKKQSLECMYFEGCNTMFSMVIIAGDFDLAIAIIDKYKMHARIPNPNSPLAKFYGNPDFLKKILRHYSTFEHISAVTRVF